MHVMFTTLFTDAPRNRDQDTTDTSDGRIQSVGMDHVDSRPSVRQKSPPVQGLLQSLCKRSQLLLLYFTYYFQKQFFQQKLQPGM